jgi:hypothetical protein
VAFGGWKMAAQAYILQVNGFPAGEKAPKSADDLSKNNSQRENNGRGERIPARNFLGGIGERPTRREDSILDTAVD